MLQYHPCTLIISGGAKGADTLAKRYAAENNIPMKEFLPNWDTFGKSAGYLRNKEIVENCDGLVAFCSRSEINQEPRLKKIIDTAEILSKPVYIIPPKKEEEDDFIVTI